MPCYKLTAEDAAAEHNHIDNITLLVIVSVINKKAASSQTIISSIIGGAQDAGNHDLAERAVAPHKLKILFDRIVFA